MRGIYEKNLCRGRGAGRFTVERLRPDCGPNPCMADESARYRGTYRVERLSDAPVLYAHTREDSARNNYLDMPAVQAEGAPVVTFYGVTAEDISLVFLESIGDLYVDYDRVKPQVELDYRLTQGDDSVSYRLDTAYNFEFTVKTQQGSDTLLVVSRRSDITG